MSELRIDKVEFVKNGFIVNDCPKVLSWAWQEELAYKWKNKDSIAFLSWAKPIIEVLEKYLI